MQELIDLVNRRLDHVHLDRLLNQLRALDRELDQKTEDIRNAQQNVTVLDRLNVFTNSDSELALRDENHLYRQIRNDHGAIIAQIKDLIRETILADPGLSMKVRLMGLNMAVSALRVQHQWSPGFKTYGYKIVNREDVYRQAHELELIVNAHFGLPPDQVGLEDLTLAVYDDVLRKGGFIE